MVEKGKKHIRKDDFQGFSVFHLCGFYALSVFLGTFFLAAIEKTSIFAIVKTKFAIPNPSFQSNPKSCRLASKN